MSMTDTLVLLFALLWGHALGDYPLQGDFLAKAKNHWAEIPGVPWYQALFAHALIQAGIVTIIVRLVGHTSLLMALIFGGIEFVLHAKTDYEKCNGNLTFNMDQCSHVVAKMMYVYFVALIFHA